MIPVIVGQFVKRQTRTSEFGYFSGTWDELAEKVQSVLDMGIFKSGYREGVILVPLSTKGFFTSIVKYSRDIITETIWEKRQEHEEPVRKSVAYGKKSPATKVDIVLYRKNVLSEDPHHILEIIPDYWEIISINVSPYEFETPMTPFTMARNQLVLPGGTKGEYSGQQYAESIVFWNSHCMIRERE